MANLQGLKVVHPLRTLPIDQVRGEIAAAVIDADIERLAHFVRHLAEREVSINSEVLETEKGESIESDPFHIRRH